MHSLVDLICMRHCRSHTVYCNFSNFQALLFCEFCSWELQLILQVSTKAQYALLGEVALGKPPAPILNWICVSQRSAGEHSGIILSHVEKANGAKSVYLTIILRLISPQSVSLSTILTNVVDDKG